MNPRVGYLLLIPVALMVIAVSLFAFSSRSVGSRSDQPTIRAKSCVGSIAGSTSFDASPAGDSLYRFVYDNVFRQNLARGYLLATTNERSGLSMKAWATGNIPVVPEPVSIACTAGAKRSTADKWLAILKVNGTFYLATVLRQDGRWLVDYFLPMPHAEVPQA